MRRRAAAAGLLVAAALVVSAARAQDAPRQDAPRQDAPKPDAPKSDAPKPEEPKPDAPAPQEPPKPAPPARAHAYFPGTADDLAAQFPALVRIADFGRSAGGKPLRIVTVSASRPEEVEWRTLVVAHLSGLDHADTTALALDVAARLAERGAELPPKAAFRFVLDGNPDAHAPVWWEPARAGNATPTDEDQDGDVDEDAPDDVDGDGVVTWMRVPDASGDFAEDEKPGADPRRADASKGFAARWRIVPEGRDDDGDGAFNEDGPGGVDVSRNFAVAFEEHVPPAGRWAVSEPETRALMDLLLADEKTAVVYEIGRAETLAANPEWGGAWTKLPEDDAKLLEGLRGAHGKGAVEKRTAKAPGAGSLGVTVWHQLGRIWVGRAPMDRTAPPWPAKDGKPPLPIATWTWKPAGPNAPTGAETPRMEPSGGARSGPAYHHETESVTDFLLLLAKRRAQVAFTRTETSGESGVLRLETRLVNEGLLPTHTQRGAEVRGRRPLNVRIRLPDGATLVAGRPLVQVERLGPGASSDPLKYVVSGPSGAVVRVECVGPDTGTRTLEVRIP